MPSLNFILTGHDALSRVFDRVGDSAQRLHRRIDDATNRANANVGAFTRATTQRMSQMQRDTDAGAKALDELKKTALSLAPAAIPAAASLAPIAAGAGAAAVAMGAMGAAMGPQISALGDIADAQKKYDEAVQKSGPASQEAAAAQAELARTAAQVPKATREAAASVGVLKDNYKEWSDGLADDTMAPFTKGVQLVNALLPKTSGLVKAASSETDRFITIIGGTMASPGLDGLNTKFTAFAQKTLRSVNDGLVHLLRTSDSGKIGGAASEFMSYARAQGPAVAAILKDVSTALVHVLKAGSDVGVGMLQVVQVLASVASAIPPGAISMFLQLAVVMKATRVAALGLAAGRTAVAGFAAQVLAMQTAAAGASGGLGRLGAAFGALSKGAKLGLVGAGIGLLAVGITQLSKLGKEAPPNVDRLTTSLGNLGRTGAASGEASRLFGKNLSELYDSVRNITDPTTTDKIQQGLVKVFSLGISDSTPHTEAKEKLDAIDDALTDLAQNGKADLAAAAFKRLSASYVKGGGSAKDFKNSMDGYTTVLADQAFEAKLTADSMGIFGSAAQDTKAKLDAQKQSADGLRASLIALNETNRSAYDAEIGFEQALADLSAAFKDNGANLDIHTAKGRANGQAMSKAAKAQDELIASGIAAGDSFEAMTGKSARLRTEMMRLATEAFEGNEKKAKEYVNRLLGTPDKVSTTIKLEQAAAVKGLKDVQAQIKATPGAKKVTVDTLSNAAIKALEAVGLKTKQLPDGKTEVYTANGQALGSIGAVSKALSALNGKKATTWTFHNIRNRTTNETINTIITNSKVYRSVHDITGATGGLFTGGGFKHRGYAKGGLVDGPGTGTSDDVFAPWLSKGEFVINARRTKEHLPLLKAINSGGLMKNSGHQMAAAGTDVGRGLAQGLTGSMGTVRTAAVQMAAAVTAGVKGELEIASPSKKMKALAKDIGKGLILGLTGSRDKIKSTAKDLATDIRTAFSGKKESRLLDFVSRETRQLDALAAKRDKIAAKIAAAKKFASDTAHNARESAGLANLGLEGKVTAGGIKAGLASKLAQLKQFSKYIDILRKRGLNRGMIRQILNMGPEQGYAYASALVGASKDTIKQVNSLDNQIGKASDQLGKKGADILYDSGKNAGKGYLKGLESQQKEIEKLMVKIAKGMEKAIKKALGIKSPSTVMAKVGVFSAQGLAHGLVTGMPHVDRALGAVAGRVAATRPVIGRPAVGAGAGVVYNVKVDVHDAMDPIAVGREMQRVLVQFGRAQGGTVSLKVGG